MLETVCESDRFAFTEYSKDVAVEIPFAFTAPLSVAVALFILEAKFEAADAFMLGMVLSTNERTYEIRNDVLELAASEGSFIARYIPASWVVDPKFPRYVPELARLSPASQIVLGFTEANPLDCLATLARESKERSPSKDPFVHSAFTKELLPCPTTVFVEV